MMTHFLRGGQNDILVLDEPDIYLHADLQRRLYHIAKKRFGQIFIATHSSEIMNEANASDVILIRPNASKGSRITSESGYRNAHALLGSSENADFARLARAKRVIAFEGSDRSIYRHFERLCGGGGVISDPDTLTIKVGGYENWQRVENLGWLFKEVFGLDAKIFAVFDRDFRCDEEVEQFEDKLRKSGIACHVLRRKEIENYLLEKDPLKRAIERSAKSRDIAVGDGAIEELLDEIAEREREECLISTIAQATKFFQKNRDSRDEKTIMLSVKQHFDADWTNVGFKKRIGGKIYISEINKELQYRWKISVTPSSIMDSFRVGDVSEELKDVIREINKRLSN
jgi:hypothetical protein